MRNRISRWSSEDGIIGTFSIVAGTGNPGVVDGLQPGRADVERDALATPLFSPTFLCVASDSTIFFLNAGEEE